MAACLLMGLGLGMISTGASAAATLTAGSDHYASAVGASMTARQLGRCRTRACDQDRRQ